MNILNNLDEIIKLLENEDFVKAHDLFEELWRKYKNNECTREESFILKALVNGSVFFEVYKMQRYEHAKNLWDTYKKYEYLIEKLDSQNKDKYKKIKELIYEKREKLIK